MASAMFSTFLARRSFSVFRGSPLVCARKKAETNGARNENDGVQEPKMPPKPFGLFLKKKMDYLKQENPQAKYNELMEIASDLWKKLPDSEKKIYSSQFQSQYKAYVDNMYQYYQQTKTDDPSQTKKCIIKALKSRMGRPVAPKNAFLNFAIQHAHSLGKPFVIPHGITEGRQKWDQLTESEKNKYIMQAKVEREKYEENLLKWEKKMFEDGHELLVRAKSIKQFKHLTALDP